MKKRVSQVGAVTFGPRRDKTCLRGSRQKRDSNWSFQLQGLARKRKFRSFQKANNEGTDQSAWMTDFLTLRPIL